MVMEDYSFSVIRNWMVGGELTTAPGSMEVGTGSGAISFTTVRLGSMLPPTFRGFQSKSGIGFTVELEGLIDSGDITTGSLVREIGLYAVSGQSLWFRNLLPEIELNGSALIDPYLIITVK